MSAQAEKIRKNAAVELTEAIRQATRYLDGTKGGVAQPSLRIVKQRMQKVMDKEEQLKACHFSYCDKAGVEVEGEEAMNFLSKLVDDATDCVDSCLLYIEEQEMNAAEEAKVVTAETDSEKERERLEGWKNQIAEEEKFASELILKIRNKIEDALYNIENMVHVRTYKQHLQDTFSNLDQSWNKLISLYKDELKEAEILALRMSIQDELSSAEVFIEQCSNEEAAKYQHKPIIQLQTAGTNPAMGSVASSASNGRDMLKFQKVGPPSFSGDVRTFAKFRKDFDKIVKPYYTDEEKLVYVLKETCLKGAAKKIVKNVEELEEIWIRLEDKYGDKMTLVDIVIQELNDLPKLKATDDQKFIVMVDLLEKGLQDLEAIGAKSDIANAYTVKVLEAKLGRQLYLTWLKEEDQLTGEGRFGKLLGFLKAERKRVEKLVQRSDSSFPKPENLKKTPGNQCLAAKGGGNSGGEQQRKRKDNCLIHNNVAHFTRKCNVFNAKNAKERADIVIAAKACILCLSKSHIGKPCPFIAKWDPCKIDNCGQPHNYLLHEAINQGFITLDTEVSGSVTTPASFTAGTMTILRKNTFLLIQLVSADKGQIISMFDNGSTIS